MDFRTVEKFWDSMNWIKNNQATLKDIGDRGFDDLSHGRGPLFTHKMWEEWCGAKYSGAKAQCPSG